MDKRNFSVLLVIVIGIILNASFAFTQDSTKSKSSEEFTALKKGNYAIYLEFGSLLFKTGNNSSDYDLLLTVKYHLTDKTALRVSGGTNIEHQTGIYNRFENWTYGNSTEKGNNSSFNTTVNLQHFLTLKSKVKPFFSLGVYANYHYSLNNNSYYYRKTEEWGIGPFASFGAEIFVLDNISIIGEYIMKGTAGKRYNRFLQLDNNNYITSENYEYLTVYNLDLKSFKAGLSIYF
jgi:outer membrane protein W